MNKALVVCIIGLMIASGGDLYAGNGDLFVNGHLGIGTTIPTQRLTLDNTGKVGFININGVLKAGIGGSNGGGLYRSFRQWKF